VYNAQFVGAHSNPAWYNKYLPKLQREFPVI